MSINTLAFIFFNVNVNLLNANLSISMWSWSVFGYMYYKLVLLLDYTSNNYLSKKNKLFTCSEYLLQLIFYILYVNIYVYKYLELCNEILLFLLGAIILLELLFFLTTSCKNNLYGE